MTHPFIFARATPDKPALIMAQSGKSLSYRQLEESANRYAHWFRYLGLIRGDVVAIMLENCTEMFELAWATERAGLYCTPVSTRLTADEAAYIVSDSGAKVLITSPDTAPIIDELSQLVTTVPLFMAASARLPYRSLEAAARRFPTHPIADESAGMMMLYSSGTTGRPKGIKHRLAETGILTQNMLMPLFRDLCGASPETVYLCPAPLYHAAPLGWSMAAQRTGSTVIVMEKFDAEETLRLIEKFRVTMAQFVPTHFVRMLKLPGEVRHQYDVSSLKAVIHAAAPCPVPVKEAMLQWWGPIIHEYYSSTEGAGITIIGPKEWGEKKGSVGRAVGCQVFVCDEAGEPLPAGQTGQIFFASDYSFEYHNDETKSAESRNKYGWVTLGDVGHIDEDGYLFLTDRKGFMIISGGVNIYPQEIENVLVLHPKVTDAAVIGAPDEEMGEKVVAVIQAARLEEAGPELAEELRIYCRDRLSGVKVPRQFDFVEELPRHPTGKLYKRLLRDRYWAETDTLRLLKG